MNFKIVIPIFLMSFSVSVADYHHSAPLLTANWKTKKKSAYCELRHDIPLFGIADFTHESGEELRFSIRNDSVSFKDIKATLTVDSAPWNHNTAITSDYLVYFDQPVGGQEKPRLSVYGDTAEAMLFMLTKGMFPRFDYIHLANSQFSQAHNVAVSSVNFLDSYQQFIDCRKDFLPFDFKDSFKQSLFFKVASKRFNNHVLLQLKKTAKYIKAVKGTRVVIASNTTMAGNRDKKWFLKRANLIVNRLNKLGVPKSKVKIRLDETTTLGNKTIKLSVFGPDALRAIYYRKGNINLTNTEMQRLDMVVKYMEDFLPKGKVIVKSYTDSKGTRANNLKVSKKRAEIVKRYLVSKGLEENFVKVKAYGESRPAKSNRFPTGRAQNRRIILDFVG